MNQIVLRVPFFHLQFSSALYDIIPNTFTNFLEQEH